MTDPPASALLPEARSTRLLDRALKAGTLVYAAAVIFSTALVQIAAVALVLGWIAKLILTRGRCFRRTVLDLPYAVLIAARLASIAVSVDLAASLQALYVDIFFYIMFFVFTNTIDLADVAWRRNLLRVLTGSAGLAAAVGLVKYFSGLAPRAASTTAGYYTLGLYLCVTLPLVLMEGRDRLIFGSRWVWAAASAIIMAGIVFTFDRIHWIGMAAAVVVTGLMRERRLAMAFAVGVVVIVLASPRVAERAIQTIHITTETSGRNVLWEGARMLAGERPVLGFGPRTFARIFPLWEELPNRTYGSWHNDYIQIYMESGLVGLLALLWLIVTVYVSGYRYFRKHAPPEDHRVLAGGLLLAFSILFVVGGVFDTLVALLFRLLLAFYALLVSAPPAPIAPANPAPRE